MEKVSRAIVRPDRTDIDLPGLKGDVLIERILGCDSKTSIIGITASESDTARTLFEAGNVMDVFYFNFEASADIVQRGDHEGEKVIKFCQNGKEYGRVYHCCWNHYYNCSRARIGIYFGFIVPKNNNFPPTVRRKVARKKKLLL